MPHRTASPSFDLPYAPRGAYGPPADWLTSLHDAPRQDRRPATAGGEYHRREHHGAG
jgi:hypothetical protein